jgi:hypothetical protein
MTATSGGNKETRMTRQVPALITIQPPASLCALPGTERPWPDPDYLLGACFLQYNMKMPIRTEPILQNYFTVYLTFLGYCLKLFFSVISALICVRAFLGPVYNTFCLLQRRRKARLPHGLCLLRGEILLMVTWVGEDPIFSPPF